MIGYRFVDGHVLTSQPTSAHSVLTCMYAVHMNEPLFPLSRVPIRHVMCWTHDYIDAVLCSFCCQSKAAL